MIASLKWSIRSELQRKAHGDKEAKLSYIELQAMSPPYTPAEEIADYMDIVFNFGFISMFGVVAPVICILCFVVSFPMKRLVAYQFCYGYQRIIPRIQEGIGSWSAILNFVAYMGVTVTAYIVVFIYNLGHTGLSTQVITFVIAERAIVIVKYLIESFLGAKSIEQQRIEEHNDDVLDEVLEKVQSAEKVHSGTRRTSIGGKTRGSA